MLQSKHFKIHELVPLRMYNHVHDDLLWKMVDDKLIRVIDRLKEKFPDGMMIINDYKWGGDRGWSGIRTKDSEYYSEGSMHSVGKAVDIVMRRSGHTIQEMREYILANQDEFPEVGGVELASWLHVDVREHTGKILLFDKKGMRTRYDETTGVAVTT